MARNQTIGERFFFFNAPIAIVVLAKDRTNGILAAQNMEFVAEANGLGVLFSGFLYNGRQRFPQNQRKRSKCPGKAGGCNIGARLSRRKISPVSAA